MGNRGWDNFDTQEEAEYYMFEQDKEVMTQTTEQDRADFEALCIEEGWNMTAIMLTTMPPKFSYYADIGTQRAYVAWQAARRTLAAPVPQWDGKINAADFNVETFRRSGSGWLIKPDNCVRITHVPTGLFEEGTSDRSIHTNKAVAWERLSSRLEAIAAAPQPTEAAPVQMPEPYDYVEWRERGFSKTHKTALYTEQQVMDLLKSHGISVKTSK